MTERTTARLFRAARAEGPSCQLREQTLQAMLDSARTTDSNVRTPVIRRPVVVALTAVVAAAAFVALVSRHEPAPDRLPLAPEPLALAQASASAKATPSLPASTPSPVETHSASAPPARPHPSLADEAAALERIRRAIAAGDTAEAFRLLDQYRRGGASNRMSAEGTLLRIEALARSGRTAEARQVATDFIAANPGNPLSDRARSILASLSGGTDAGALP